MNMKERLRKPLSNWIKFAVWAVIYILFIAWVGNFWWLLLLPFIFDIFITKFIPWSFWKKTKNKTLYSIFSWIDAIVFALVAVYFINIYLFQNYQIPSSSLERTLLVGDFLAVSKCSYGPRIPNTPLSLPLVQHTIPGLNCKSYIEKPQWEYKRLKGWDTVERGDIVVFNFPAGDTVPLNFSNPDYYTLCYSFAGELPQFRTSAHDSVTPYNTYKERMAAGRKMVRQRECSLGRVVWRPVDRRENYVKRCVALPGDTLEIRDNAIYINGILQENAPGVQHNYFVQTDGAQFSADALDRLNVNVLETMHMSSDASMSPYYNMIGLKPLADGSYGQIYLMALTQEALAKVKAMPAVKGVAIEKVLPEMGYTVYPLAYSGKWGRDNFGPLWIPAKGATIPLTEDNIIRYERCIVNYEHNTLDYRDGRAYLNGEPADTYTFKMDYYWMMGDNRHNSADSRSWGFVPEDHIVGRPVFVWLSLDKAKGWLDGKIRWNRFGKDASQ